MPIERRLPRLKNIAEEENEDEDDDENSVFFFFYFTTQNSEINIKNIKCLIYF